MSTEMRDLYVWLDERLQQITTAQQESHGRLRSDMTAGFAEIRVQFEGVFEQARKLNDRTLIIETERKMERRQGIKTGVIWGSIAGAASSAIIPVILRALSL